MRWSQINYPDAMRKLRDDTRMRAIHIANQLVDDGMDDNLAVITAIGRAEAWTHHRNDPPDINEPHRNYKHRRENG